MKRWLIVICFLLVSIGCSSTQISTYVKDQKPFSRRFYADHQRVKAAATQALVDLGWKIDKELEPQMFEVDSDHLEQVESILLVTEVRETRMFLTTRYTRMNIYVYSNEDVSDVEMRYMAINDMVFLKPKTFGSDSLAQRFFARMQLHLGE